MKRSWSREDLGYQGATGTGLGSWGDDSKGLKNENNQESEEAKLMTR